MRRECPQTGTTGSWVLPHLNTEKKFQVPSKRCPAALDSHSNSNTSFSSVEGHLKFCNTSRIHFLKRLTNHWKHYSNTTKIPRPRPIYAHLVVVVVIFEAIPLGLEPGKQDFQEAMQLAVNPRAPSWWRWWRREFRENHHPDLCFEWATISMFFLENVV